MRKCLRTQLAELAAYAMAELNAVLAVLVGC